MLDNASNFIFGLLVQLGNQPVYIQVIALFVFLVIVWKISGVFFTGKSGHEYRQKIRVWGDPDISHWHLPEEK